MRLDQDQVELIHDQPEATSYATTAYEQRSCGGGALTPVELNRNILMLLLVSSGDTATLTREAWKLGQLLALGSMASHDHLRGCNPCKRRSMAFVVGAWRCLLCGEVKEVDL